MANSVVIPDVIFPVTPPDRINFSKENIWFTVNASAPGREVLLSLYAEKSHYAGNYDLVISSIKPALADSKCHFQVNNILAALVEKETEIPDAIPGSSKVCEKGILNYFLSYAEIDPATGQAGANPVSSLRTVIRGGLPQELLGTVDFLAADGEFSQKVLTWAPDNKFVSYKQPEYLYFLCQDNALNEVTIKRTYFNAAGSDETMETLAISNNGPNLYRMLQVPAFPAAGSGTTRVEVVIQNDQGIAISETRKFIMQQNRQENYFLFENSVGGYDTLLATGETEITLDGKDEIAERILLPDDDQRLGQYSVFDFTIDRKIKQATGFHSNNYHKYLQDFLYAKRRYQAIGNRMVPIILRKRGFNYQPGKQQLTGYTFEYDYAFEPTAYANY